MASKRTTNNSTIVNLEEQTAVIAEVLEEAGDLPCRSSKNFSERSKGISKKKTKKPEQTLPSLQVL